MRLNFGDNNYLCQLSLSLSKKKFVTFVRVEVVRL